jgi:hypothetical protein
MAKSNLDKLKETIAACIEFISQASVGDETGQYSTVAKEAFQISIQEAESLVASDGIEPSQFETENSKLNEAKELFVSSKNIEQPKEEKPEIVELKLIGTPSQRKGSHSIHFSGGIVTFTEGKVVVPAELGAEIKKAGYAE